MRLLIHVVIITLHLTVTCIFDINMLHTFYVIIIVVIIVGELGQVVCSSRVIVLLVYFSATCISVVTESSVPRQLLFDNFCPAGCLLALASNPQHWE